MNPYEILGLDLKNIDKYTKDDIKQIYKKIALECHPDKLNNCLNENERSLKIERFKQASLANKMLCDEIDKNGKLKYYDNYDIFSDYNFDHFKDDYDLYKNFDMDFWESAINIIKNNKEDIFKNTFIDVAGFFFKNNFKHRNHYNPSVKIIKHNIVLPIKYGDIYVDNKKKLRLILKGVKEPVFLNVYCKRDYPMVNRQYIDDDGLEHDISIRFELKNNDLYSHDELDNGKINLITHLNVGWKEYLLGGTRKIQFIDGSYIYLDIKPFKLEKKIYKGLGLFDGDLIVFSHIQNIEEKDWFKLDEKHKNTMISILKMI